MQPYMNYAVNVDFDVCMDEYNNLEDALAWFFTDEAKDVYEDDWEDAKIVAKQVYEKRVAKANGVADFYKLESTSIELLQHVTRNLTNDLVAFEFVVIDASKCYVKSANAKDLTFYADEYVRRWDADAQYTVSEAK